MKQDAATKIDATDTRSDRGGAQVWITGALDMIMRNGVGSIKIERLAREIGVSKGSFYWFFHNTDELLKRCLAHWKMNLNNEVFDSVRTSTGSVRSKMFDLIDMVFQSKLGRYDAAIRAWGMTDPNVFLLVAEVDRERLSFLVELFIEHGLEDAVAKQRAHLFYRAFLAESYLRSYPDTARKGVYLKQLLDFILSLPTDTAVKDTDLPDTKQSE